MACIAVGAAMGCGSSREAPPPGDADPVTTPGVWHGATFSGALGSRAYRVYVPANFEPQAPAPLLLLLHGCAQTIEDFAAATRVSALADTHGLLVLMPSQSVGANAQRCWNWFLPQNQAKGGEAALLMAIVDEVQGQYAVDPARLFVAGLSAGGAMSAILASCYADRFAGAGVHSGLMFEAANDLSGAMGAMLSGSGADPAATGHDAYLCSGAPARATPVLVLHGDADTTVAPTNGEQVVAQFLSFADFADNGVDDGSVSDAPSSAETLTAPGGLTYDVSRFGTSSQVEAILVHGMGHAWSGGVAGMSYSDADGPDATAMLWTFLAAHAR